MRTRANLGWILLAALLALPGAMAAQEQVTTSRAIRLQRPPKPKVLKLKAEVIHANLAQITVRDRSNPMVIRTFAFTPEVEKKMEKIITGGGFRYGDRVEIHHQAGREVALRIKGKPSKSR